MRHLPRMAQFYIWIVVIVGGVTLGTFVPSLLHTRLDQRGLALFFLLAVALAETHQIPIAYKTSVTLSCAVSFAAVLLLGPGIAAWSTAVGLAVAYVYLRRVWYNVAFNTGAYAVTVSLSGIIYRTVDAVDFSQLVSWQHLVALVVAAIVYFSLNTALVAIVVGLREHRHILATWLSIADRVVAEYSVLILLGIFAVAVYEHVWWTLVLLFVPLVLIYRSLLSKAEERVLGV